MNVHSDVLTERPILLTPWAPLETRGLYCPIH